MFEAVGVVVSRLMRVRYGPVSLPPRLKRGMWTELPEVEVRKLTDQPAPQRSGRQKATDERQQRRAGKLHRTTPRRRPANAKPKAQES